MSIVPDGLGRPSYEESLHFSFSELLRKSKRRTESRSGEAERARAGAIAVGASRPSGLFRGRRLFAPVLRSGSASGFRRRRRLFIRNFRSGSDAVHRSVTAAGRRGSTARGSWGAAGRRGRARHGRRRAADRRSRSTARRGRGTTARLRCAAAAPSPAEAVEQAGLRFECKTQNERGGQRQQCKSSHQWGPPSRRSMRGEIVAVARFRPPCCPWKAG